MVEQNSFLDMKYVYTVMGVITRCILTAELWIVIVTAVGGTLFVVLVAGGLAFIIVRYIIVFSRRY